MSNLNDSNEQLNEALEEMKAANDGLCKVLAAALDGMVELGANLAEAGRKVKEITDLLTKK